MRGTAEEEAAAAIIIAAKQKVNTASINLEEAGCDQDQTYFSEVCLTLQEALDAALAEVAKLEREAGESSAVESGGGLGIIIAVILVLVLVSVAVYIYRATHNGVAPPPGRLPTTTTNPAYVRPTGLDVTPTSVGGAANADYEVIDDNTEVTRRSRQGAPATEAQLLDQEGYATPSVRQSELYDRKKISAAEGMPEYEAYDDGVQASAGANEYGPNRDPANNPSYAEINDGPPLKGWGSEVATALNARASQLYTQDDADSLYGGLAPPTEPEVRYDLATEGAARVGENTAAATNPFAAVVASTAGNPPNQTMLAETTFTKSTNPFADLLEDENIDLSEC